jgi:exoribonuclease-2
MLAPRFSEDLCSLLEGQDRLALVTEMTFAPGGKVAESKIFRALVRNQAALNYDSTGAWLEGRREPPLALADHQDVLESVRLQDQIAQRYQQHRRQRGSLTLESLEARAVVEGDLVVEMAGQQRNRATELIENVMVACNGCASRYLTQKGFPTFQRIVRRPKHWSRIVTLAQELGCELPEEPESKALQQFLEAQRASRPQQFPDLSLQVLKLLGRGEYVVELPDQPPIGHFGLAVREYSHSTAPNRRYPDLITQRLLKAALAEEPCPYGEDELEELARHCSEQEANAQKIERHMAKSAAAAMLRNRLGETFEAVASGHNERATWVRLLSMPVEGMLDGWAPLGRKLRVRLERVDIKKGFIDFSRLSDPR